MGRLSKRQVQNRGRNPAGKLCDELTWEQKNSLITEGFVVLPYSRNGRSNVTEPKLEELVEFVLKSGFPIINNESRRAGGDQTRLMSVCELDHVTGRAAKIISGKVIRTFPHLRMGLAAFLVSKAHGHDQQPHTDVEAGYEKRGDSENTEKLWEYTQQGKVPLSVVLTYGHEANLIVWPRSQDVVWAEDVPEGVTSQRGRLIHLPVSARYVHAGCSYEKTSLRLHFYLELDVQDFVREENTTQPMDSTFFLMPTTSE